MISSWATQTAVRAAASSIASGRLSSRVQSSTTLAVSSKSDVDLANAFRTGKSSYSLGRRTAAGSAKTLLACERKALSARDQGSLTPLGLA